MTGIKPAGPCPGYSFQMTGYALFPAFLIKDGVDLFSDQGNGLVIIAAELKGKMGITGRNLIRGPPGNLAENQPGMRFKNQFDFNETVYDPVHDCNGTYLADPPVDRAGNPGSKR